MNKRDLDQAVAAFREEVSRWWPPTDDDFTDDDVLDYLAYLEQKNGRSPIHDAYRAALWRMWFERDEEPPAT